MEPSRGDREYLPPAAVDFRFPCHRGSLRRSEMDTLPSSGDPNVAAWGAALSLAPLRSQRGRSQELWLSEESNLAGPWGPVCTEWWKPKVLGELGGNSTEIKAWTISPLGQVERDHRRHDSGLETVKQPPRTSPATTIYRPCHLRPP